MSTRLSNGAGIVSPSIRAVCAFMMNSNLLACTIGVRRLRTFENTASIDTRQTKSVHNVGSIAHQSSDLGILAPCIYGRQMMERCQLSQLDASAIEECIGSDEDRIWSLATHCCEGGVDLGASVGVVD